MTTVLWLLIFAVLFLIVVSAFFSGSETALTAASRARMHTLEKNGDEKAKLVTRLIENRERLIGGLLLGNNLVNILASAIATSVFIRLFGDAGVVAATLVMTVIVVIFAEVLPKSLAISNPDTFALRVSPVVSIVVAIFAPFTKMISRIVRWILKWFGINLDENDSYYSASDELRGTVEVLHRDGSVVKDDRDRLGGLLDLHELELSDVMIHRTDIEMLDADETPAKIVNQVLSSQYTRLPLWRGDTDNIIGVVHAKDVLRALAKHNNNPKKIDVMDVASKPWFVPETTTLKDQLNAFLQVKAHLALVVDEYGEFEGLVTLEDILEEIVGEIADEHDIDMKGITPQPDGSILVEGSVPIRDINRALDWQLPDDEATSIAGLVIHEAQMIPEEKQTFSFYGKRFVVQKREKNRITLLRVRTLAN